MGIRGARGWGESEAMSCALLPVGGRQLSTRRRRSWPNRARAGPGVDAHETEALRHHLKLEASARTARSHVGIEGRRCRDAQSG